MTYDTGYGDYGYAYDESELDTPFGGYDFDYENARDLREFEEHLDELNLEASLTGLYLGYGKLDLTDFDDTIMCAGWGGTKWNGIRWCRFCDSRDIVGDMRECFEEYERWQSDQPEIIDPLLIDALAAEEELTRKLSVLDTNSQSAKSSKRGKRRQWRHNGGGRHRQDHGTANNKLPHEAEVDVLGGHVPDASGRPRQQHRGQREREPHHGRVQEELHAVPRLHGRGRPARSRPPGEARALHHGDPQARAGRVHGRVRVRLSVLGG